MWMLKFRALRHWTKGNKVKNKKKTDSARKTPNPIKIKYENEDMNRIKDLARDQLSANVRSYGNDQEIFFEGTLGSKAYIILAGCVRIYSGETHLACRREDEIVGEQVLFQKDGKRTASAKSLGHTRLLEFEQSDIQKLDINDQLPFWLWYSRALSKKLAEATLGRVDIDGLRAKDEGLLRKFVPSSGIDAARTALLDRDNVGKFYKSVVAIIWFSDLTGFSFATNGKEPNYVANMISTLLGEQIKLIEQSGGEIDKLMGDGLMAFWLLPDDEDISTEDISTIVQKAVKSALAVNETIPKLASENEWPVGIRIGMHVGDVVVGSFGTENRFSYTILGEAVNSASRYEQVKDEKLGTVRISPDVFCRLPKNSEEKQRFLATPHPFNIKGHSFKTHVLKESAS